MTIDGIKWRTKGCGAEVSLKTDKSKLGNLVKVDWM